jgi:hypothetical protein
MVATQRRTGDVELLNSDRHILYVPVTPATRRDADARQLCNQIPNRALVARRSSFPPLHRVVRECAQAQSQPVGRHLRYMRG